MSTAAVHEPKAREPSDLEHIPNETLYEVVDGCIVEKPMSAYSMWIASFLFECLAPYVRQRGLGTLYSEGVFVLQPGLKRRPDVAFLSASKWPIGDAPNHDGDWEIIPDLAVEVISPSNLYSEVVGKLREYFFAGVVEVWVVVPEARIVQIHRGSDEVRTIEAHGEVHSELLPGWSMEVSALMPKIIPRKTSS